MIADGTAPADGAAMGLHASFELRTRSNIPKHGAIEPELARTLKHAYLASTSYVDAQIGLLLKSLDEAGQRDNTIIIVWGDHGWHLGEVGVWGDATIYEIATRATFFDRRLQEPTRFRRRLPGGGLPGSTALGLKFSAERLSRDSGKGSREANRKSQGFTGDGFRPKGQT